MLEALTSCLYHFPRCLGSLAHTENAGDEALGTELLTESDPNLSHYLHGYDRTSERDAGASCSLPGIYQTILHCPRGVNERQTAAGR